MEAKALFYMAKNVFLFVTLILITSCSFASSEKDVLSSLDNIVDLAKEGDRKGAIELGLKTEGLINRLNLDGVTKLQYLAVLKKELSVVYASLSNTNKAIKESKESIAIAKLLTSEDEIFYFDYFNYKENMAEILNYLEGEDISLDYRFETISEIKGVLGGSSEKMLSRTLQKQLQVVTNYCDENDNDCGSFVSKNCKFLREHYWHYLDKSLDVCIQNGE